jgi:hypothetical protein
MSLPGTWLLAQSKRFLDEAVVESAIVPTVADLQHEALGADGSAWRRSLALVRGYSAIIRILFSLVRHGLIWRSPMRRLLQILAGAATFTACYVVMALWVVGYARGPYRVPMTLGVATLLGVLFAAISVAVYMPLLLAVRRGVQAMRARVVLSMLGAALFPLPMLAVPFLQGQLAATCGYLLRNPGTLLWVSAPYVVAGALLGWLLADRPGAIGQVAAS